MGEAVELLRAAFLDVVVVDLAEDQTVEYVHRLEFAHGSHRIWAIMVLPIGLRAVDSKTQSSVCAS
jgi:hypothetical protein